MFLVDGILRCLHIHKDQVVLVTCFNAVSGVVDHRHVGAVGIFKEALKVLLKTLRGKVVHHVSPETEACKKLVHSLGVVGRVDPPREMLVV